MTIALRRSVLSGGGRSQEEANERNRFTTVAAVEHISGESTPDGAAPHGGVAENGKDHRHRIGVGPALQHPAVADHESVTHREADDPPSECAGAIGLDEHCVPM